MRILHTSDWHIGKRLGRFDRLDEAEAERAEYGWMLPSTRARARLLKPGTMVVSQPAIPVPLVVTFPFPPWATRKEEVADAGVDPFAGLT